MNIAQAFVRDPAIVEFVVDQGVRFVTTSAGDPTKYTALLKDAGLTVFHVVPTLRGALKAIDAGVDGLVVEGVEGGGFKNPDGPSSMVLIPLVRSRTDLPIVAAGGFVDGPTLAAALVLGADGVQMGTRMVAANESPVHDAWKQAVVGAAETDTVILNRRGRLSMRVLRTDFANEREFADEVSMGATGTILDLYFGGDMNAAPANTGQVAGRIHDVLPVAEILHSCVADAERILAETAAAVRSTSVLGG